MFSDSRQTGGTRMSTTHRHPHAPASVPSPPHPNDRKHHFISRNPIRRNGFGCALLACGVLILLLGGIAPPWSSPDRFKSDYSNNQISHTAAPAKVRQMLLEAQGLGAPPTVCILGNAQTVEMARVISSYWPNYHAFWAVWGQSLEEIAAHQSAPDPHAAFASRPPGGALFHPFPCKKGSCPWKVGMEHALAQARASGAPCEYFFTSDDDR